MYRKPPRADRKGISDTLVLFCKLALDPESAKLRPCLMDAINKLVVCVSEPEFEEIVRRPHYLVSPLDTLFADKV